MYSFLFLYPFDVLLYALVCYKFFLGGVALSQGLFIEKVMNAVMALFASHDAPLSHLLLPIPFDKPFLRVYGFGYEVMFGERFISTTKLTASAVFAFHATVVFSFCHAVGIIAIWTR